MKYIKLYLTIAFLFQSSVPLHARIITYPVNEKYASGEFSIKVRQAGGDWQPVMPYLVKVANLVGTRTVYENASMAYFDFSGKVDVLIDYNKDAIKNVRIRPSSLQINPSIEKSSITFSLDKPCNLSIELNGDIIHNLHLFSNEIKGSPNEYSDSNLIYFGPGVHQIGVLKPSSNKTIYIAGGAILQGQILMNNVDNVRIHGNGILTYPPTAMQERNGNISPRARQDRADELVVEYSNNIQIGGIVILANKYSIRIGQSSKVKISNVKSISSEGNADGIDVFCSKDVAIDHVFMRNSDDCIAIYGHRWRYYGNTSNVEIRHSVLWADVAHPVLIGTHGDSINPDTLSNMQFEDIDIFGQHENQIDYQGCLALNAGDGNLIDSINFENIRIDDIRTGQLINLRVMFNKKYNTSPGKGIRNILFKDIYYDDKTPKMSILAGYDENRTVKNIRFENLRINGKIILDTMPGKPAFYKTGDMANILLGEHLDGVQFGEATK